MRKIKGVKMRKNWNTKTKIGELFLVLGTGLFVVGAIGFIAGYLSQEQIPANWCGSTHFCWCRRKHEKKGGI